CHVRVVTGTRCRPSGADRPVPRTEKRGRPRGRCGDAPLAMPSPPRRATPRRAPPLTFEQAAVLNTAFIREVAGNLLLAGRYAPIAGYVAFAPAGTEELFHRMLPPDIGLIIPNLGDCFLCPIAEKFGRGHAPRRRC